jgi:hypothetical protein
MIDKRIKILEVIYLVSFLMTMYHLLISTFIEGLPYVLEEVFYVLFLTLFVLLSIYYLAVFIKTRLFRLVVRYLLILIPMAVFASYFLYLLKALGEALSHF